MPRNISSNQSGNKAHNALFSLPTLLSLLCLEAGGEKNKTKLRHHIWCLLFEPDLRHCFLHSPWLPASWLVEDWCMFICMCGRVILWQCREWDTDIHSPKPSQSLWKAKGLCGSANLISHPVRALLPKAQGRRDKTQQFVHILIAYPPAEKDKTCLRH